MKIDAHQHFWRYSPEQHSWMTDSMAVLRRDYLPEDLEPEIADAGIDRCIAVQALADIEDTRWLLELAGRYHRVCGVVGWVDLQSEAVGAQLEELGANPLLVGIRHLVQDEPDDEFLLRPEVLRGLAEVGRRGLAYDLLLQPRHLRPATEAVRRLGSEQRFVLDHLAKPPIARGELEPWARDLRQLAALPNVACKVSGMVTEADRERLQVSDLRPYLDVVFEAFGVDRLLFGSDWPVCRLAASYGRVVELVSSYTRDLPQDSRARLFGGNAVHWYGLPG